MCSGGHHLSLCQLPSGGRWLDLDFLCPRVDASAPPWGTILENLPLSFPRRGPYRPPCSVSSVPREPATAPGRCGFSAVGAGDPQVRSSRANLWLTSCHEDGAPSVPLDPLWSHGRPVSVLWVLPERSGFLLQHPTELGSRLLRVLPPTGGGGGLLPAS